MVAALTLLVTVPVANLSLPMRLAGDNERRLATATWPGTYGFTWFEILILLAFLAIVTIPLFIADFPNAFSWLVGGLPWLVTGAVAVIATIAFFPYIHFIYPVPQYRDYYTEATHAMWLPAERIELNTGRVYYGYVLSSANGWFTVLLANSRVIVDLLAREVVGRSVCRPMMSVQSNAPTQPKQYPPLIPWLYHQPRSLPSCARRDEITVPTPYLSKGESLNKISKILHVQPERIISITNAYQHGLLSARLRAYECRHDWNAPTPVGQHFWYYPSIVPY
jgi:hypothetical protein